MRQFNQIFISIISGHFTQVVWKGSRELGVGVANKENYIKFFLSFQIENWVFYS